MSINTSEIVNLCIEKIRESYNIDYFIDELREILQKSMTGPRKKNDDKASSIAKTFKQTLESTFEIDKDILDDFAKTVASVISSQPSFSDEKKEVLVFQMTYDE